MQRIHQMRWIWHDRRAGLWSWVLGSGAIGFVLLAGFVAPHSPFESVASPLQPPSRQYLMGTDDLGRDVFSAVLYGAQTSMLVGIAVAGLGAGLGAAIGLTAAYWGGHVDHLLMRLTEFFQVLPRFFLAVIVVALFGAGLLQLILVLGLTSWTTIARVVRAEALSLREREFIVAARAIGAGHGRVLWLHLLPNLLPSLVVATSLLLGQAILVEAGLSFLGLGDPNRISWGLMLSNARPFMRVAWWMSLFPGLAITVTVLGVNLIGDRLLNPAW